MKRLIVAVLALAIILAAGILEHLNVDRTFEEFSSKADELDAAIMSEEVDIALELCEEITIWWDKKRDIIEAFSYSPDTRSISVTIGEIEGSLLANDLKNAQSKIISLKYLLENVHNTIDFNVQDIF